MFRKKEERLDDVVEQFLRASGLETPLLQHRLMESWAQVVGESVASRTTVERIQYQKLWVKVHTPALRTQLQMMRQNLVRQLNDAVGGQVIYELVIS